MMQTICCCKLKKLLLPIRPIHVLSRLWYAVNLRNNDCVIPSPQKCTMSDLREYAIAAYYYVHIFAAYFAITWSTYFEKICSRFSDMPRYCQGCVHVFVRVESCSNKVSSSTLTRVARRRWRFTRVMNAPGSSWRTSEISCVSFRQTVLFMQWRSRPEIERSCDVAFQTRVWLSCLSSESSCDSVHKLVDCFPDELALNLIPSQSYGPKWVNYSITKVICFSLLKNSHIACGHSARLKHAMRNIKGGVHVLWPMQGLEAVEQAGSVFWLAGMKGVKTRLLLCASC